KIAGLQSAGDEVVKGEGRGDQRPPSAIRGQRAERVCIAEDQRDITQIADVGIRRDGMKIVEVKTVVEMVAIDSSHDSDDRRERQKHRPARQTHADQSSADNDSPLWRKIQARCIRKLKPNNRVSTRIFERITPSGVAAFRIRIPTYDISAFRTARRT